ncbi:serine hydrolase [Lapidilactobacillus mulanensis]|uniref:serine-type D-Ala-D-Ala carboxypeptidase n=1 Tax=Lapidilactobacillus mulanensis TaxID=2485999 RepID=A0ABW4DLD1_9LACO|nr:serine hydrolase [Lapidilactobacillus mulanensis]
MKTKLQRLFLAIILVVSVLNYSSFAATEQVQAATKIEVPQATIAAKAGMAVDVETGQVLANKNSETAMPIASLTKLLSIYLVLQAVKQGKLTWNQQVTPTADVVTLSRNMELSNIPFETAKSYTVKELYEASLIYSANAAVMALADTVSGSQDKFVDAMKAQLLKWGIKDAKIVNASGMSNSFLGDARYPGTTATDENEMSARDIATVAQHLLKDYPEILDVTSQTKIDFHGTAYPTWNLMLKGESAASTDFAVDGLKTGTSDLAGDCFVGTVKKNGFRIITVILNADGQAADQQKRFTAAKTLMEGIYQNWHQVTILQRNQANKQLPTVKVSNSKQTKVSVVSGRTVTMLLPKSVKKSQLAFKLNNEDVKRNAPIKKGANLGSIQLPNIGTGYLTEEQNDSIPILAKTAVQELSWWQKAWRKITGLF